MSNATRDDAGRLRFIVYGISPRLASGVRRLAVLLAVSGFVYEPCRLVDEAQ